MNANGQFCDLTAFPSRKNPCVHWIGGCLDPWADVDVSEKRLILGFVFLWYVCCWGTVSSQQVALGCFYWFKSIGNFFVWVVVEFFFLESQLQAHYNNPITGLDRPLGFQEVEAPRFLDNRHMKVVKLAALRTGRLYPPGNIPSTHFC
jgi:hypothetical protein